VRLQIPAREGGTGIGTCHVAPKPPGGYEFVGRRRYGHVLARTDKGPLIVSQVSSRGGAAESDKHPILWERK
jgi:hypothetical protein